MLFSLSKIILNLIKDLTMEIWEIKLKEYFENAVVDKELMQKFESFKLPRFVSE